MVSPTPLSKKAIERGIADYLIIISCFIVIRMIIVPPIIAFLGRGRGGNRSLGI